MQQIWIGGAVRTAIGALNGAFAATDAVALGRAALAGSLERSGVAPADVDEVIFGNVLQAGLGQNPARQIAMAGGVPREVPSFTVNQVCGSGLKAIDLARQSLLCGNARLVAAGGVENMSNAPHLLPQLRRGVRLGDATALDSVVADGLTDAFSRAHMGLTAERVAADFQIDRQTQDKLALESQQRYAAALARGEPQQEIVAVSIKGRRETVIVDRDEHPRADTTLEALARLRPAFKPDGTVTAGNASGINDGAASVLLASDKARLNNAAPLMRVRDITCIGCAPETMGLGPIYAVRQLLARQHMSIVDIDLWELNEAFTAQAIAVERELALDHDRVNIGGGAIAMGHPIGCSGARIVVTLMHHMKRRQAALGVAALCVGGGMGLAIMLENC